MTACQMDPGQIDWGFIEFCRKTLVSLSYIEDNTELNDDEVRSFLLRTGTERIDFLKWILQQCIGQELNKYETHDDLKKAYVREGFVAVFDAEHFILGTGDETSQLPVWKRIFRALDAVVKLKDPKSAELLYMEQMNKWAAKSSPYAKFESQMRNIRLELDKVNEHLDLLVDKKDKCEPEKGKQELQLDEGKEESADQIPKVISSLQKEFVDIFETSIMEALNAERGSSIDRLPQIVDASLLNQIAACVQQFKFCVKTKAALVNSVEKLKQKYGESRHQDISKSLDFSPLQHIWNSIRED